MPINPYRPDPTDREIVAGQRYRHFKGEIYEIVGIGVHTETEEELVFYRDIQTGRLFARPLASFLSIPIASEKTPRFELIEEGNE
jgi:hypothetical protein